MCPSCGAEMPYTEVFFHLSSCPGGSAPIPELTSSPLSSVSTDKEAVPPSRQQRSALETYRELNRQLHHKFSTSEEARAASVTSDSMEQAGMSAEVLQLRSSPSGTSHSTCSDPNTSRRSTASPAHLRISLGGDQPNTKTINSGANAQRAGSLAVPRATAPPLQTELLFSSSPAVASSFVAHPASQGCRSCRATDAEVKRAEGSAVQLRRPNATFQPGRQTEAAAPSTLSSSALMAPSTNLCSGAPPPFPVPKLSSRAIRLRGNASGDEGSSTFSDMESSNPLRSSIGMRTNVASAANGTTVAAAAAAAQQGISWEDQAPELYRCYRSLEKSMQEQQLQYAALQQSHDRLESQLMQQDSSLRGAMQLVREQLRAAQENFRMQRDKWARDVHAHQERSDDMLRDLASLRKMVCGLSDGYRRLEKYVGRGRRHEAALSSMHTPIRLPSSSVRGCQPSISVLHRRTPPPSSHVAGVKPTSPENAQDTFFYSDIASIPVQLQHDDAADDRRTNTALFHSPTHRMVEQRRSAPHAGMAARPSNRSSPLSATPLSANDLPMGPLSATPEAIPLDFVLQRLRGRPNVVVPNMQWPNAAAALQERQTP